jgi:5-methylcytosine-specific restriction protein B
MNLARVEQYFAEVLSRIEQGRGGSLASAPLLSQSQNLSPDDQKWSDVFLSVNLAIVGTVNMDDSTHGFSKKVLDRAFTLEFSEIDLKNWERQISDAVATTSVWPVRAWRPRATRLAELTDLTDAERKQIERVIDVLIEINEILNQAQLQLAYRSRDEIVLFTLHANDLSKFFVSRTGQKVDPLDLAIQMKVLPRISGGSGAIQSDLFNRQD